MKFINFTQHNLTEEQIEAAKALGATEIIDAKSVLSNFNDITNDDGNTDSAYQAQKIAEAIVALAGKDNAIVHFPVSSPRVQASFWRLHEYWAHPTYADTRSEKFKVWEKVRKCRFVFSHTSRISQDIQQPDGSVKKTTVFKFEKFVQ